MRRNFIIEVSERIKRLPPYLFGRLNALKYQKRRSGIDIIDLGMGNPNDPTPKPVIDKLCEAVQDPRNHRYSEAAGIFNLRREVAKHYAAAHSVTLDPEKEIICTIGSKEGFSHLCLALLGPGDTALLPSPAFPIHVYGPALAGANVISVPMQPLDTLVKRMADVAGNLYPKPKVLILNFPHNPTTATVDLDFFRDVYKFARAENIVVLSDFAYGDTVFDGYRAPSFLHVRGAKQIGVEFSTMSKAFNMAGWRVGFCAGNSQIIDALRRVKGYYDYGLFQPVQIASIIALRHCTQFTEEQARVYQTRRDVLCDGLERIGWNVDRPKATMFVWARIPEPWAQMGSIDFAFKLMEEAEVAVAPGRAFGEPGEGYLRLALVEKEPRLRQAVRQIRRALRGETPKRSRRSTET